MENQEAYERAKHRVAVKPGFYVHLIIYIAVSILLVIVNLSAPPEYLWFGWPILGWGTGLFFHALGVFVFSGRSTITEQMIEKEMKNEASEKH